MVDDQDNAMHNAEETNSLQKEINEKQKQIDALKRNFQGYVDSIQREQRITFSLLHSVGKQQMNSTQTQHKEEKTLSWLTEQRRLLQQQLLRSQ